MLTKEERVYHELLARLNGKERHFVSEYLVHCSAAKSARKAGYSSHCAKEIGYELLTKPHIAAAVDAGLAAIAARLNISAEKIVRELTVIAFASAHQFEESDGGHLCLAEDAPPESAAALQIRHRRIKKSDGTIETETSYVQADKTQALLLLGKRLRLFVDRVETENPQDALHRALLEKLKAGEI